MISRFIGTVLGIILVLIVAGAVIWIALAVWTGILDQITRF